MTSLEELLDQGDRSYGGRSRSRLRRLLAWVLPAVLGSLLFGGGLVAVLLVLDYRMWYPAAPAAVFAVLLLHRVVAGVSAARHRPAVDEPEPAVDESEPPGRWEPDGRLPALARWHDRLRPTWQALRRPAAAPEPHGLRPQLAELVDERLRLRHGCNRSGEPERARRLLGERLWTYLADPSPRTPAPRELAAILTAVEEL